MTGPSAAPARVLVERISRHTAVLCGPGSVIVPACKVVRAPRQWDDQRRGWAIPASFLDDVTAAIELQFGGEVVASEVDR